MGCKLPCRKHSKFKSLDRRFVEFWHEYFQSTGIAVRDLPIKHFISAVELARLCDLSACTCKDLIKFLYPLPSLVCSYCPKSFRTLAELDMHVAKIANKSQHQHQQPSHFQCIFCAKVLVTKIGLIRHMELMHTKEHEGVVCKKTIHAYDIDRHQVKCGHLKRAKIQSQRNNRQTKC